MVVDDRYRTIEAFNKLIRAKAEHAKLECERHPRVPFENDEARQVHLEAVSNYDEARYVLNMLDLILEWLDWQA